MCDETPVQKFYQGSHILITGGTGFLGKVLVEKLLRSCPGIVKIYLLIRVKNGVDPISRWETLISNQLFERINIEVPNFAEKLEVLLGDCVEPNLGLSPSVREELSEKVNVVFHSAATVRFQENLKRAYTYNVVATRHLLEFCKGLKNLKSVIHVSTAYSNCHLDKIEDIFYDPPTCNDRIEKLCEHLSEEEIDVLTPFLLQKWPNTYTFTKAIAEATVKSLGVGLPIGIFRPAVVVASYSEPIPGWIDNYNGATGLYFTSWLGIRKVLAMDRNAKSNLVPVDLTVNALILTARATYDSHRRQPGEIKIYGFESNSVNPLNWLDFSSGMIYWTKFYPSNTAVGIHSVFLTKSKTEFKILSTLFEVIPGHFIDLFRRVTCRKPWIMKCYKKIQFLTDITSYFTTRTLNYRSKNFEKLFEQCTDKDKKLFFCDLKQIDWNKYTRNYLSGMRKYLRKESEDTIGEAQVRQKKLFWIYAGSRIIFIIIMVWMTYVLYEKFN